MPSINLAELHLVEHEVHDRTFHVNHDHHHRHHHHPPKETAKEPEEPPHDAPPPPGPFAMPPSAPPLDPSSSPSDAVGHTAATSARVQTNPERLLKQKTKKQTKKPSKQKKKTLQRATKPRKLSQHKEKQRRATTPRLMTSMGAASFLTPLGLAHYVTSFDDKGFDVVDTLEGMGVVELKAELGMSIADAQTLHAHLARRELAASSGRAATATSAAAITLPSTPAPTAIAIALPPPSKTSGSPDPLPPTPPTTSILYLAPLTLTQYAAAIDEAGGEVPAHIAHMTTRELELDFAMKPLHASRLRRWLDKFVSAEPSAATRRTTRSSRRRAAPMDATGVVQEWSCLATLAESQAPLASADTVLGPRVPLVEAEELRWASAAAERAAATTLCASPHLLAHFRNDSFAPDVWRAVRKHNPQGLRATAASSVRCLIDRLARNPASRRSSSRRALAVWLSRRREVAPAARTSSERDIEAEDARDLDVALRVALTARGIVVMPPASETSAWNTAVSASCSAAVVHAAAKTTHRTTHSGGPLLESMLAATPVATRASAVAAMIRRCDVFVIIGSSSYGVKRRGASAHAELDIALQQRIPLAWLRADSLADSHSPTLVAASQVDSQPPRVGKEGVRYYSTLIAERTAKKEALYRTIERKFAGHRATVRGDVVGAVGAISMKQTAHWETTRVLSASQQRAAVSLPSQFRAKRGAFVAAARSAALCFEHARPDAAALMAEWILEKIPRGPSISVPRDVISAGRRARSTVGDVDEEDAVHDAVVAAERFVAQQRSVRLREGEAAWTRLLARRDELALLRQGTDWVRSY